MREWDADLFIRAFKPLGYQKNHEAYEPHFVYDPTSDKGAYRAAWYPKVNDLSDFTDQCEFYMEVEGFTDSYIPVSIRVTPQIDK